ILRPVKWPTRNKTIKTTYPSFLLLELC
ncbi:unnamed protein product, partial [Rotaria sordida]